MKPDQEMVGFSRTLTKIVFDFRWFTMSFHAASTAKNFVASMILTSAVLHFCAARAQPALISVVPANHAVNVPTNTTVVFTFNTSMDTGVSSATFYYNNNNNTVPVTSSWSANNTVLTCTPVPGFPPETNIMWSVIALSTHNELITPTGTFTTAAGGTTSLVLSNAAYSSGVFSFTVSASPGQSVVVEYQTNPAATNWPTLLTTNSPGNQFSVSTPTGTNKAMFFRARNGP